MSEIIRCLEFIDKYVIPHSRYNNINSYALKHHVERYGNSIDDPLYVSNESFKEAMKIRGYLPKEEKLNEIYKIKVYNKFFISPTKTLKWV